MLMLFGQVLKESSSGRDPCTVDVAKELTPVCQPSLPIKEQEKHKLVCIVNSFDEQEGEVAKTVAAHDVYFLKDTNRVCIELAGRTDDAGVASGC